MDEFSKDQKTVLREEQNRLIKVIEAFSKLENSEEWSTLKELVFDKSLVIIERQILIESTMPEINTDKLYRLQGERAWAKQYNDTGRFIDSLKNQLTEIKKRL